MTDTTEMMEDIVREAKENTEKKFQNQPARGDDDSYDVFETDDERHPQLHKLPREDVKVGAESGGDLRRT